MKYFCQLLSILSVLVSTHSPSFGAVVDSTMALVAAKELSYTLHTGAYSRDHTVAKIYYLHSEPAIYIVKTSQTGYIIVAAEDRVYPILGYSTESDFSGEEMPPALEEWIDGLLEQINIIRENNIQGPAESTEVWEKIYNSEANPYGFSGKSEVKPLLKAKWNQVAFYNAYCPEDMMGPGGHALVGCVAVAMGQICHYYRHPDVGTGSSSYNHYQYGYLSANFSSSPYNWNEMGNTATSKSFHAIAKLLSDLGISVNMNYGNQASGAYSHDAAYSLATYFKFDQSLSLVYKNSYTEKAWNTLMKSNLDAGQPMYYRGQGSGGHAFNLDGYQNDNFFHFNWGWGGLYDGYFYLSSLTPPGNSFSSSQGAIINIKPLEQQYPPYCNQPQLITGLYGIIEDGSGPVLPYLPNSNCTWHIKPSGNIENIKLTCQRFETEPAYDILEIYDGDNDQSPLIAVFSGDTIWDKVESTGGELFLKFTTNHTTNMQGWAVSYEAYPCVFCSGTKIFTANTGSFDDGSGASFYNNNSNCKYLIDPAGGAPYVTINFDYFSLEDGRDFLRVYDPTTFPTTLLATLTGNQIPGSITANNGKLLLVFNTDNMNTDIGWKINYNSNVSGMETYEAPLITISPNPSTTGIITISYPKLSANVKILVTDIAGKVVFSSGQFSTSSTTTNIDLSHLANGTYLLRADLSGGYTSTKKIILNK